MITRPVSSRYREWQRCEQRVAHVWNLFHVEGGPIGRRLAGLWDVSLDDSNGALNAYVLNLRDSRHYAPTNPMPIPKGRSFQLEFYPKSAIDATGAVALHQDGEELLRVTDVVTNDTPFSQWYEGNFAGNIPPNSPTSTLYVDEVSVRLP